MREGVKLLDEAIEELDRTLVIQVRAHRHTVLLGRTWLQPGPPATLGLKLAGTLAALRRDRDRIAFRGRTGAGASVRGAVGTLAALGTAGGAVSAELARVLNLREPELTWHTQRDNLAEMVQVLAILTGTLGKFARDVALLMQAEVGEAFEAREEGRGGSSTMPHKQNPVGVQQDCGTCKDAWTGFDHAACDAAGTRTRPGVVAGGVGDGAGRLPVDSIGAGLFCGMRKGSMWMLRA